MLDVTPNLAMVLESCKGATTKQAKLIYFSGRLIRCIFWELAVPGSAAVAAVQCRLCADQDDDDDDARGS